MKKILLTLVLLVGIVFGLLAQQLTYQAVIRDNSQQLVTNTAVKATVTIDFAGDQTDYNTTITGVSTNIHGLLSFEFGGAELSDRDWTNATIAVKVVNAATPSTVYVNDEARPVSAVPYALSVNGQSIQNYLNEHHYVDLDKLNDTLNAYSTTVAMDARHYLTSDSAVIGNMRGDITTNANSIADLTLHTAKNAIRDSVEGQIHDSIVNIAANVHTHGNKALLDTYTQTEDNLAEAVAKRHEHANAAVLAATQAPYTDADSTKLDGIEAGAEVNVQADWNQTTTTADDYIKNKPSISDTVNTILTTEGYVTETTLDGRHYLTSDSAVITTMQGNISKNANSIDNLILHTAKAAIRDSVEGQIHDSIVNIAANVHTHGNKALLDTYTQTEDNLAEAVAKRHEHANAAVLAATQAPYTDADSTKLDGIEAGAEVNVQADWNQTTTTADDYIKNKPSIKDTVNTILTTEGYVTATALDARHYLTSDSAVIGNMRGDISTNKENIQTNTGTIGALAAKEQSDSSLLAGRINALESASMDCDEVKDCIKDTLSKYTPTTDLCNVLSTCQFSEQSLADLLQGLSNQISDLQTQVNAQNRKIDSLSALPHGGGDTPATFSCGTSKVKDVDNNEYNTVKIGNQCWMKENLRTNVGNGVYPKYPNDHRRAGQMVDDSLLYGRLYTWSAVTKGASTTYPKNAEDTLVHGICPAGWHVPSDAEWDTLTYYVFNSTSPDYKCGEDCGSWSAQSEVSCIAKALASKTGWSSDSPECSVGNAPDDNNATGFSAVPAGQYKNNAFYDFGTFAYFWSATSGNDNYAYYHLLLYYESKVYSFDINVNEGHRYSVRCLRDAGIGDTPSTPGTVSCEQVMECMGDTLGKLNDKIVNLNATVTTQGNTITTQGQTIDNLNSTVESLNGTVQSQGQTITAQSNTIDSLAHVVDSLSNLPHGGGTPGDNFSCGSTVTDHQGNVYHTVQIGNQCWTKENMRCTTSPITGESIVENLASPEFSGKKAFYYGNDPTNADNGYGLLYNWYAAVDTCYTGELAEISLSSHHRGICPNGWHVPSNGEWEELTEFVKSQPNYRCGENEWDIAKALASNTGWNADEVSVYSCSVGKNTGNNNATGFSALPAGYYHKDNGFVGKGDSALFWSSTSYNNLYTWGHQLSYGEASVIKAYSYVTYGLSVRCVWNGIGIGDTPSTPGTVSCEQVMECMGDTLGKLNDKIVNLNATVTGQGAEIETLEGTVQSQGQIITEQGNTIDSLEHIVDSLSNLTPDTPVTPTDTFDCGTDKVKDAQNNEYNTVKIGDQCWMKENLRTITIGTRYPGGDTNNVATYGLLYDWAAVMQGASSTNYPTDGKKVRGICPEGWHVPSNVEWDILTNYVKSKSEYICGESEDNIAKALSSTTGWTINTTNNCVVGNSPENNNETGFSAFPAGGYYENSGPSNFSIGAYMWSSTQKSDGYAWYRLLGYAKTSVVYSSGHKSTYYSVRCLRDADNGDAPSEVSCDDVMRCLGDTLGKLNAKIESQGTEIETLNGTVTTQGQTITAQGNTIDSLAHIVDSLSKLPHGGGDTPDTPDTPTAFSCGTDKVQDADGNEYNTVKIGNQCWMKENLRTNVDGSVYPKKGDTELTADEKVTYGRLYTWTEMMKGAPSTNYLAGNTVADTIVHGICPEGWHVPSDAEWDTLTKYVYNSANPDYKCSGCESSVWEQSTKCIAKALSSTTGWSSNTDSGCNAGNTGDKANATGFSAVPAGICYGGNSGGFGFNAYFWSATVSADDYAWYRNLDGDDSYVRRNLAPKDYGFSVRCLRDAGIGGGDTPDTPDTPTTIEDTVFCYPNLGANESVKKTVTRGQNFDLSTVTFSHPVETNWEIASWNTKADGTGTRYERDATISNIESNITLYAQWRTFCTVASVNNNSEIGTTNRIDTLKDGDNNKYSVVKIGNQCWMKENLRTNVDGSVYPKKGDTELTADEKVTYGRLYTWTEMMKGAPSTNYLAGNTVADTIVHGICPEGWHVPSDAEWIQLTDYVNTAANGYRCDGDGTIANALSSSTGWQSPSDCGAGHNSTTLNATGFSAVPAGYCLSGSFFDFGFRAYFWSATQYDDYSAWCRYLYSYDSVVGSYSVLKDRGFSVRCLRD